MAAHAQVADACAVAGSALLAALGKGSSSAGLLGGVVNMQGLAEEKLDVVVLFVGSQVRVCAHAHASPRRAAPQQAPQQASTPAC